MHANRLLGHFGPLGPNVCGTGDGVVVLIEFSSAQLCVVSRQQCLHVVWQVELICWHIYVLHIVFEADIAIHERVFNDVKFESGLWCGNNKSYVRVL